MVILALSGGLSVGAVTFGLLWRFTGGCCKQQFYKFLFD